MDRRSADFLSLLAYAYLRNGKAAKALTLLDCLGRLAPETPGLTRSLAYASLLAGDYTRALKLTEGAPLKDDPFDQMIRSRALYAVGRRDEAQQLAEKAARGLRA